jgi:hypothetical protein
MAYLIQKTRKSCERASRHPETDRSSLGAVAGSSFPERAFGRVWVVGRGFTDRNGVGWSHSPSGHSRFGEEPLGVVRVSQEAVIDDNVLYHSVPEFVNHPSRASRTQLVAAPMTPKTLHLISSTHSEESFEKFLSSNNISLRKDRRGKSEMRPPTGLSGRYWQFKTNLRSETVGRR